MQQREIACKIASLHRQMLEEETAANGKEIQQKLNRSSNHVEKFLDRKETLRL